MAPLQDLPVTPKRFHALRQAPNGSNDYSFRYQHTGELPQSEITNVEDPFEGYPNLQKLQLLKSQQIYEQAAPPAGLRIEPPLINKELKSCAAAGARFDCIMVGGCIPEFDEEYLKKLAITAIQSRPCLVFLWCPPTKLEEARRVLVSWSCRRSEDIVYMVTNPNSFHMPPQSSTSALKSTTWHCLMGIRGTVRRSEDSHLIHCNLNTDVIVEPENPERAIVPTEIYTIIDNLSLMMRKVHIVPQRCPMNKPLKARMGWVTMGPDSLLSNFNPMDYTQSNLAKYSAEVERLRPQTPPHEKKHK